MLFRILFLLIILSNFIFPQNSFRAHIVDTKNSEPLIGVNVYIDSLNIGGSTNINGDVIITGIPNGTFKIYISYIGYKTKELTFNFSKQKNIVRTLIKLQQKAVLLNKIIVTSTRTGNRVEEEPVKVEVLGTEEVNEEIAIKPGNISKLLGETTGIQIQQNSQSSGNLSFKLEGLPGRYTQLLQDGLPIYSGFSEGLSLLQIPPLNLKQVEVIKGASSTFYGEGAVAGIVNLISRTPSKTKSLDILLNRTSRQGIDFSGYYSIRNDKFGVTFLGSGSHQNGMDVNNNGFTDIPQFDQFSLHPTFYFYINKNSKLLLGFNYTYDNRKGGDFIAVTSKKNFIHSYFEKNKTKRIVSYIKYSSKINSSDKINFKASINKFNRNVTTPFISFEGDQVSAFSEFNYLKKIDFHKIVLGLNINYDNFSENFDIPGLNYKHFTIGIFAQDNWKISNQFILQTALRFDHNNDYGNYFLQNISIMYKPVNDFFVRLTSGGGYKIPSIINDEFQSNGFQKPASLSEGLKAEKSQSINLDFNYSTIVSGDINISINQAFYYTRVTDPLTIDFRTFINTPSYLNAVDPLTSKGTDTNLEINIDDFSIFADYSYTDALKEYDKAHQHIILTARNKLNLTFTLESEKNWRSGIEAFYTGSQYLSNGTQSPSYWVFGIMFEKMFQHFSITGNIENVFNVRQSDYGSTVLPPISSPTFKEVFAPLEGSVANIVFHFKL